MVKIDIASVITGTIILLAGIVLIFLGLFGNIPSMIWGIILLILGVVILATLKQQEEIEQIKNIKKKGK